MVRTSLSDISWQQATLPLRLGGLGIRQASEICYAAYLGSCSANKDLVCRLLGLDFDTGFVLVGEVGAQQSFSQQVTSPVDFLSISQTLLQSTLDDHIYSNILSRCSIRDRARLSYFRPFWALLCLTAGFACPSAWVSNSSCRICCGPSPLVRNTCIFKGRFLFM